MLPGQGMLPGGRTLAHAHSQFHVAVSGENRCQLNVVLSIWQFSFKSRPNALTLGYWLCENQEQTYPSVAELYVQRVPEIEP